MSEINNIEKFVPDYQIEQDKIPYTILMNYVLQNLNHIDALGLWTYLSSLPPDWGINKKQIMNHFKKGRDFIDRLFKILSENKLIEIVQLKGDGQKFSKNLMKLKSGREFYKLIEKQKLKLKENLKDTELSTENEPLTEKPYTAEPLTVKPQHTNTIKNTNTNSLTNNYASQGFQSKAKSYKPNQSAFASVENQTTSYHQTQYTKPKQNQKTEELIGSAFKSLGVGRKKQNA